MSSLGDHCTVTFGEKNESSRGCVENAVGRRYCRRSEKRVARDADDPRRAVPARAARVELLVGVAALEDQV
jgi:hypothetical protein